MITLVILALELYHGAPPLAKSAITPELFAPVVAVIISVVLLRVQVHPPVVPLAALTVAADDIITVMATIAITISFDMFLNFFIQKLLSHFFTF
jgi:hypothetical protein